MLQVQIGKKLYFHFLLRRQARPVCILVPAGDQRTDGLPQRLDLADNPERECVKTPAGALIAGIPGQGFAAAATLSSRPVQLKRCR